MHKIEQSIISLYFRNWMDFKLFAVWESCWTSSVDNNFKLKWVRFASLLSRLSIFLLVYAAIKSFHIAVSFHIDVSSAVHWNAIMLCRHIKRFQYICIYIYIDFHANDKRVCHTLSKEKGCFWHKIKFLCFQSTVCRVWLYAGLDKPVKSNAKHMYLSSRWYRDQCIPSNRKLQLMESVS